VFQCYKSFWVFALAWIFLFVNYVRNNPLFLFTYWGVVSASIWVLNGTAQIAAVSRCGVATATVLNTSMNSVVQFLASILTDESMVYRYGASEVPLAPFYLVAVLLGNVGLILSPTLSLPCFHKVHGTRKASDLVTHKVSAATMSFLPEDDAMPDVTGDPRRQFMLGVPLAMLAGLLGGLKYALSSIGHRVQADSGRAEDVLALEFGVFESYMMSFGVGCAVSTIAFFIIFAVSQKARGHKMPSAKLPTMKFYGFLAGFLWMGHYMCAQAANNVGGSGSFGPAVNAIQLITAGLWGLLYYREIKDPKRIACWAFSAAWTIAAVVLLAGELKKK
jgi:glucose uptake protein GlcU